jgi:hypothetical protein
MKLCPACDRHLFGPEAACPFCGEAQVTTSARASGGVLASVTLALTLGAAACGPQAVPEQTDTSSSTTAEDTGPSPSTTVGTTVGTTTVGTTVAPTTDDGPAMTTIEASSSDSSDDNPCAFYAGCPPDVDTGAYECDVFQQDCPEGEKCLPWANDGGSSWNATRCSPVAPDPGAPGEPCTVEGSGVSGIDSCDVGAMCFHVDVRTNEGVCVTQCTGSFEAPYCDTRGQVCASGSDGLIALCYDACNPLDPACAAGTGCHPEYPDAFICRPTSDGTGTHGDECFTDESCASAHACLDASSFPACTGLACCSEFCDTTAGLPCPGADQGVVCQPWYEEGMAPAGYENVGACVLPP